MSEWIRIGERQIGPNQPVYIVAELSANHHGRLEEAVALVEAAKECGADAVKLQTYTADTLTLDCDAPAFRVGAGTLWEGRRLYDLYREAATPWEWHPTLQAVAKSLGLDFFSTPFDRTSLDFLDSLGVPAFKIASFELVDLPLLAQVAQRGKPIILSTGMASWEELQEAVTCIHESGCDELVLLKCTSAYPAPVEEMNLRAMEWLRQTFRVPVGLSDHTLSNTAAVAAVALGAPMIEKHFTLSRKVSGPDSAFSLEPAQFKAMVKAVRATEKALGVPVFFSEASEARSMQFRRSLFVVQDMQAGELFTKENVRSIRPADGLAPKHLIAVLGRRAARAIERGTPLAWDLVV
jgi:pseudaminic acid synthase